MEEIKMNIVNPKEAMIQSLHDACSFNSYKKTLELTKDLATDVNFQKNFTNYYRVRRDDGWLQEFYKFFEENKNNKEITFEKIIRHLSNVEHKVKKTKKNPTGKAKTVEPSFASKMLATINPNHPIWDGQVLRALNIKVDEALSHEDKIKECIEVYQRIEKEIATFIATDEGQQCIALFDKVFPSCKCFSDYKKIDFYLWNLGK
jgi:hypothetical protein